MGILAGTTARGTSSVFASILGIHEADEAEDRLAKAERRALDGSQDVKRLLEDEHSSQESDSLWGESRIERAVAPNTSRRRVPGQLLRETIHEEEDDSI